MDNYRKKDLQGRQHFNDDFPGIYYTAGTEGQYDQADIMLTAITHPDRIYLGEIKDYTLNGYMRDYYKFSNYQIDYSKIHYLVTEAKKDNRIPFLYVRFHDWTFVWRLDTIPYDERKRPVLTNDDGQNYGASKSVTWQTYLYANEAVWSKKTNND